ncbi:MAG: sulfurtransferase TusA [Buchnera aphidicola (Eriosoma harunire)]
MQKSFYHIKINLTGLRCPDPIIYIRKTLRTMHNQNILLVITDDPTTTRDIPIFCHFVGHSLTKKNVNKIPYQYYIKKK